MKVKDQKQIMYIVPAYDSISKLFLSAYAMDNLRNVFIFHSGVFKRLWYKDPRSGTQRLIRVPQIPN